MYEVDFLTKMHTMPKFLRKQIKNIDDSYKNPWDILAELIQNSVDAVIQRAKIEENFKKGIIEIIIDKTERSLKVRDNGIGISKSELVELLGPHATNKDEDEDTIGEKGVGLTFVIFSANHFEIKTGSKRNGGFQRGVIKGAKDWKNSKAEVEPPRVKIEDIEEFFDESGTEVYIKDIELGRDDFIDFNIYQLEFLLRTCTAIGNTRFLWEKNPFGSLKWEVRIIINDLESKKEKVISFRFFSPVEELLPVKGKPFRLMELQKYLKDISKPNMSDMMKRQKLRGKILTFKKIFREGDKEVKAYAFLIPSRKAWEQLKKKNNLESDEENSKKYEYLEIKPGILTSVKGMPTGIFIQPPLTGAVTYWNYIFILLEYNKLSFDIGRKSIHPSQVRFLQKFAREVFNEFQKITKWLPTNVDVQNVKSKSEIFVEIEKLKDLNSDITRFSKYPNEQEAMISAIFFELLGKGYFKGFTPLYTGYKSKYDLYGYWRDNDDKEHKMVIEFKYYPSSILKDFGEERKLFSEVDCIVCWEVREKDKEHFEEFNLELEEIEFAEINLDKYDESSFPNSKYKLLRDIDPKPIYIVPIKDLLFSDKQE